MTSTDDLRIHFRIASGADALCIGVLGTQVFLDTYATDGIRPSLAHEVLEHFSTDAVGALLTRPRTTFILAETQGHLVGFVQLTAGAPQALAPPGNTVELNRLYVQQRHGGKGIGKALLRRAEAWAKSQEASSLWLTAWVNNERALAFYARQGYTDAGASVYAFRGEEYENRIFVRALPVQAAT